MDLLPKTDSVVINGSSSSGSSSSSYWACGHFLKIYTEWVNSHLEKRNRRCHRPPHEHRLISHLPTDLSDGILLAEVVHAVTDQDIKLEINDCPQDYSQKVENIERCLRVLTELGVKTEQVAATDIQRGDLSAIFALLFALSRFKQQKTSSRTTGSQSTGQRSRTLGALTHGSTPCLETSTSSNKLWRTNSEKRHLESLCASETNIVQWSASPDCPQPPLPLADYVTRHHQRQQLTDATHVVVSTSTPLKTIDAQRQSCSRGDVDRVKNPFRSTPTLTSGHLEDFDVNHNIGFVPQKQTTSADSHSSTYPAFRSSSSFDLDSSPTARCRSGTREPVICASSSREPAETDLLNSDDMSKIALLLRSGKMRSTAEEEMQGSEANGNHAEGGGSPGGNGFHLANGREHQNAPRDNARTAFTAKPRKTIRNASLQETNGNGLSSPEGGSISPDDKAGGGGAVEGQGNNDPTQKLTNQVQPGRVGQVKEGGRQAVRLDSDRILVSPTDDRRGPAKCTPPIHRQNQSLDGATKNGVRKQTMQSEDGATSKLPQYHVHSPVSSAASSSSSSSSKSLGRSVSSRCISKATSVNCASPVAQRSRRCEDGGQEVRARSATTNNVTAVVGAKRSQTGENIERGVPGHGHVSLSASHVGANSLNGGEKSVKRIDSVEFSCRDSARPQHQQPVDAARTRMLSDATRSPRTDEEDSTAMASAGEQRDSRGQRHGDRAARTEASPGGRTGADGREESGTDGGKRDETWNGVQLKAMQPIASRHYHHPFPTGPKTSSSSSSSDSARMDSSRNNRHPLPHPLPHPHPHHTLSHPPPSRMDLYAVTEGCSVSSRMLPGLPQLQQQVRRRTPDAAADSGYSSDSGAIYSRWKNHQTRPHHDALRTVRECIENPAQQPDSVSDCRLLDSLALSEKTSNRSKIFDHQQSCATSGQCHSGMTSCQSQSGVTSSGVKPLESNILIQEQNAVDSLACGRSHEHGEHADTSRHCHCQADNRSLEVSPATEDANRATLPRTQGKVKPGHWLRSGIDSGTSEESPADPSTGRARQSNDDDRRADETTLSGRTDRLLRQEVADKRPSKGSSHRRSPSLVAFSVKDDKKATCHSIQLQQQRRGSCDGQRPMAGYDQRDAATSLSSSSPSNPHDYEYLRRCSPEAKAKRTTSIGQKRIDVLRFLSTGGACQTDDRLEGCAGSPIEGASTAPRSDRSSEGRCSDPDLVKREKPDGATQKAFGRRLQAIGNSVDAGRANRLDYCNSLPRVSRARRSESVGCGTRREGAVGRSMEAAAGARYSVGSSFAELMSLLAGSSSLPTTPKRSLSRDDDSDVHASLLSLISNASSVYSTAEEKQAQEIRKLKTELELAHEKINTLTMQLNANVHVVTAFEQSLSNMTHRLQRLTNSSEQKDQELNNLKTTLHQLQQQSSNARAEMLMQRGAEPMMSPPFATSYRLNHPDFAGLSVLNTNHRNMSHAPPPQSSSSSCDRDTRSHLSLMSIASSSSSSCSSSATPSVQHPSITSHETTMTMPSTSSAAATAAASSSGCERKPKKKGWLSTSFTKAFSRKKSRDSSDTEADVMSTSIFEASSSVPNSPLLGTPGLRSVPSTPLALPRRTIDPSLPGGVTMQPEPELRESEMILQLKQQLHDKDMKLTDIRLEALSSTHQLEQLREAMTQMKMEMNSLKTENERMQNLIADKGIDDPAAASAASASSPLKKHSSPTINPGTASSSTSSNSSVASSSLLKKSLVLGEPSHFDSLSMESVSKDAASPRYTVAVQLGQWTQNDAKTPSSPASVSHSITNATPRQVLIGTVGLTSTTKWETLDSTVRRIFKEHVCRLDPGSGLGLSGESVLCYHVGEITRTKGSKMPELLPCGYLVGHHTTIILSLRGVHERSLDSLAFETLVPKTVAQRYVSLLVEHKRLVLCGPSGIGKSYLAAKLAEYLVVLSGRDLDDRAISTFSVDCKSGRELKQYMSSIADRCHSKDRMMEENSTGGRCRELPAVIVIDNLQHVFSFEDTFSTFLDINCKNCPYIIGTMTSSTSSAASAVNSIHPVHHGFRWVLLTIHTEPVRSFLCRHLQRRLVEQEVASNTRSGQLTRIVDWMAQTWIHINRFLATDEMHSSEQSLGTRLFASCPMDVQASEEWFADLWNYSIVPFLIEATKEQQQQQQDQRESCPPSSTSQAEDPTLWVVDSYPWPATDKNKDRPELLRLRPNDSEMNGTSRTQHQQQQQRQDRMNPSASIDATNYLHGPRKTSLSSKDPLMTMLERLKEAANETGSSPSNSNILDLH